MTEVSGILEHQNRELTPRELAVKLRENGVGLAGSDHIRIDFGVEGLDQDFRAGLHFLTSPGSNLTRLQGILMPKPARAMINSDNEITQLSQSGVYAIHYGLNIDRIKDIARKHGDEDIPSWISNKFENPSVIYFAVAVGTSLMGEEELMQQIADTMKRGRSQTQEFLMEIFNRYPDFGAKILEGKTLDVYDMRKNPKAVHFV